MSGNREKIMFDTLQMFETLQYDLGEGFLATDAWNASDGQPLVENHSYNSHSKAIPLINQATKVLGDSLKESDYPKLGSYYLVNLDNDYLVVVLSIEDFRQFVLVDLTKINIGILFSIAIPNLLNSLSELDTANLQTEAEMADDPSKTGKSRKLTVPSALKELFDDYFIGFTHFKP